MSDMSIATWMRSQKTINADSLYLVIAKGADRIEQLEQELAAAKDFQRTFATGDAIIAHNAAIKEATEVAQQWEHDNYFKVIEFGEVPKVSVAISALAKEMTT